MTCIDRSSKGPCAPDKLIALARVAAAAEVLLECADDPHEFSSIKRAVFNAMQSAFLQACDFGNEEEQV
jgi:hypothetical protein